jgi:hypothetical protein
MDEVDRVLQLGSCGDGDSPRDTLTIPKDEIDPLNLMKNHKQHLLEQIDETLTPRTEAIELLDASQSNMFMLIYGLAKRVDKLEEGLDESESDSSSDDSDPEGAPLGAPAPLRRVVSQRMESHPDANDDNDNDSNVTSPVNFDTIGTIPRLNINDIQSTTSELNNSDRNSDSKNLKKLLLESITRTKELEGYIEKIHIELNKLWTHVLDDGSPRVTSGIKRSLGTPIRVHSPNGESWSEIESYLNTMLTPRSNLHHSDSDVHVSRVDGESTSPKYKDLGGRGSPLRMSLAKPSSGAASPRTPRPSLSASTPSSPGFNTVRERHKPTDM